jgi:sec-independent protein translocase protein TatA
MTPVSPVLGEIVGWEFLLVLAVVALLFGSSQLPKLARSMGQASKEFRKGMDEGAADDESGAPDDADTRDA